jgi:hypothetical protein
MIQNVFVRILLRATVGMYMRKASSHDSNFFKIYDGFFNIFLLLKMCHSLPTCQNENVKKYCLIASRTVFFRSSKLLCILHGDWLIWLCSEIYVGWVQKGSCKSI